MERKGDEPARAPPDEKSTQEADGQWRAGIVRQGQPSAQVLQTNYARWDEMARPRGALDQMECQLDIYARRGVYSTIPYADDEGGVTAPHDSFSLVQGSDGKTYGVTSASARSKAKRLEVVDSDHRPGGVEHAPIIQRLYASVQQPEQQ